MTLPEFLEAATKTDSWVYWAIGGVLCLITMSLGIWWQIQEFKSGCSDSTPLILGGTVGAVCLVLWPVGAALAIISAIIMLMILPYNYLKRRYYR